MRGRVEQKNCICLLHTLLNLARFYERHVGGSRYFLDRFETIFVHYDEIKFPKR